MTQSKTFVETVIDFNNSVNISDINNLSTLLISDFEYAEYNPPEKQTLINKKMVKRATIEVLIIELLKHPLSTISNDIFKSFQCIAQSPALATCFTDLLKQINFPSDIWQPWDIQVATKLKENVDNLYNYGLKLLSNNIAYRGQSAHDLANTLSKNIKQCPKKDDAPVNKMEWINFKFDFLRTLHSKDGCFIGHRGWKRVIANIASIIFSAGILNLMHYAKTENFFFFNKTTTQELVSQIHNAVPKPIVKGFVV